MTTMQVRAYPLTRAEMQARGVGYHYFQDVSAERAVELARMYEAARCMRVGVYEVHDDAYAGYYGEPILCAYGEPIRSRCVARVDHGYALWRDDAPEPPAILSAYLYTPYGVPARPWTRS